MRARRVGLAVVAVCVVAFCSPALAQDPPPKPGPEHERLGDWLGKWSCENKDGSTGTMTCEWFDGGFFVECPWDFKSASGVTSTLVPVIGYDKTEKAYTWYRYSSRGWTDSAKGWVKNDTWTWLFEPERNSKGEHVRWQVALTISPDVWTYEWERSTDGQPWEKDAKGKCTKVK